MKWFYEIPKDERRNYRPQDIAFGYDRLNNEFLTYGGVADQFGNLKRGEENGICSVPEETRQA
jgi:hypothetical protein